MYHDHIRGPWAYLGILNIHIVYHYLIDIVEDKIEISWYNIVYDAKIIQYLKLH